MCYKENFSKRLIYLRDKKGITQQELADNLNITRQSLSLYEKAERTINIELLAKIADFFNVSTDYLLGLSLFLNSLHGYSLELSKQYLRCLQSSHVISLFLQ